MKSILSFSHENEKQQFLLSGKTTSTFSIQSLETSLKNMALTLLTLAAVAAVIGVAMLLFRKFYSKNCGEKYAIAQVACLAEPVNSQRDCLIVAEDDLRICMMA